MKLNLYRRHRPECEAGRPWQSQSSEFDERCKDWGRKCDCQIHLSGTLDGKFSRKGTGTSDWAEAHRIAEIYEQAASWTGQSKPEPIPAAPPSVPEKTRITVEDACKVFVTNRESACVAPATMRKYRTFTKQVTTYAEGRGYIMLDQLVADVGCGRGRALIKMAQAFPSSRYVGYDVFEPSVDRATTNAKAAGVADRVSFHQRDASTGLPEQYDVITTFDVIHDAVDPRAMLRSIRHALRPDGVYVCLDINCSDKLEENAGPLGAMFHGFSIFYCMTTSLANGGVGLGTSASTSRRCESCARRQASAASGVCRSRIRSTTCAK